MSESFASPEGFEPLRPSEAVTPALEQPVGYPAPADYGRLFDEGLHLLRERFVLLGGMAGALVLVMSFVIAALNSLTPTAGFASFLAFLLSVALIIACALVLTGWAARSWFGTAAAGSFDARRFLNTCVAAFLVGLLSTLAATPIIPIGLRVLYRASYATTATAREGLGPLAAISRSWSLTKKSDRFGVWFGLLLACSLLALLPSSFALALAREEYVGALSELVGLEVAAITAILRPVGWFLMGMGIAVPAVVLGRFQVDLVVRQEGVDLRERLSSAFPTPE